MKKIAVITAALMLAACSRVNEAPEENFSSASPFSVTEQTPAEDKITAAARSTDVVFTESLTETEVQESTQLTETESLSAYRAAEENTDSVSLEEYVCHADSSHVKISGRTLYKDDVRYLGYSCSSVEFCFHGRYAEAELIPEPHPAEEGEYSYYSVTVNSEEVFRGLLTERTVVTAVDKDAPEDFRVKITKLSEGCFGAVGIGYIKTVSSGEIGPAPQAEKMIEFIGDSLTCGYGVEASGATERFSTATENGLAAYAALTAERLGMDYSIIGMNGIGIISRYTPRGEKNTEGFLMPDLYRYTDGFRSDELWDNSSRSPDICVIALGANDNSYTKGIKSREEEFSDGYIEFIKQVRQANPTAYIICASGIQRSNLYDIIADSADKYKEETGDKNICSFRFESQKDSEGYGSDYHPSAVSQKRFSEELYSMITTLFPEY